MTAVRPREQGPSAFGEAFLQDPGLFPGRRSGETWGEREIAFELAGGAYVFSGLDPSQVDALDGRFGSRVVGPDGSRVETLVFCVEAREFRELERGRPYTFDLDYSRASVRLAGPGFMARLDWTPDLRGALWTAAPGTSFGGAFENYFRVLLAYRLLDLGGALVHSAGVRDEAGGGYLLFGPSGAGKSTFARLAREAGASVLHDDLNPLCRGKGSTALKALPLSRDIGSGPVPRRRRLPSVPSAASGSPRPTLSGRCTSAKPWPRCSRAVPSSAGIRTVRTSFCRTCSRSSAGSRRTS